MPDQTPLNVLSVPAMCLMVGDRIVADPDPDHDGIPVEWTITGREITERTLNIHYKTLTGSTDTLAFPLGNWADWVQIATPFTATPATTA